MVRYVSDPPRGECAVDLGLAAGAKSCVEPENRGREGGRGAKKGL